MKTETLKSTDGINAIVSKAKSLVTGPIFDESEIYIEDRPMLSVAAFRRGGKAIIRYRKGANTVSKSAFLFALSPSPITDLCN